MADLLNKTDDLHLKEITTLRKAAARVLRDPETSSSWRSPLTSRSIASASSLDYVNGSRELPPGENRTGKHSQLDSGLPLKHDYHQKQIFLYNWRHQSNKSSDSGTDLDGGGTYRKRRSIPGSPSESSSDAHKEDSKSDTYLDDPIVLFRFGEGHLEKAALKTVKSKKGSAATRQHIGRKYSNSKLLDLPSVSSGGPLTSIEHSNDTEYCNSEDLRALTHDLMRRSGYTSKSASPWLPRRGNQSHSSKLLKATCRDDSSFSCTPASTSSYNIYLKKNTSAVESWDGSTASFNGDEVDHFDLPGRQGCGIPCYWSKRTTPKHRGCGGCYSPSLSDTLRRKGSSILCGSQKMSYRRHSSRSNMQKLMSKSSQGLPLLTNRCEGKGSTLDSAESDDELSTNFGELDLEALSRLDGRRWSLSCGSQEGLELIALTGTDQGPSSDHVRSLSYKYRPRFFDEIIGQNIVVQSLINAISRERIAPVYLFQGPRGTGKTSTARIFAAALSCEATEEAKPCGSCRECTYFVSGKSIDLREVDATNKKGMDRLKYLLKSLSMAPSSHYSHYKVFVIEECHLLPTKTWSSFMRFLEEPPMHVVFIFITTDLDNLPRTVLSRCQKYLFNKLKDADIISRLRKLSTNENLDIEPHALHLIALNADGSLRVAETMLEQLSLLGKRITASLVNELVGVVSDEKLLDLLEIAMSSDTAETVKRARELMDSGVDPMALMSQLAGLIMDIIAGTYHSVESKSCGSFFGGRNLTEAELERLKQALKLLLEAEKQLRVSSERSTWFTAALLQLGSVPSPDPTNSSNSRRQRSKTTNGDPSNTSWEAHSQTKRQNAQHVQRKLASSVSTPTEINQQRSPWDHPLSLVDGFYFDRRPTSSQVVEGGVSGIPHKHNIAESKVTSHRSPGKLGDIWKRCIDRCHSKTLRQLLHAHGRLVSFSEVEGVLIALIEFDNVDIKSRAERFLSSITNSIEAVVRQCVEVRMVLMQEQEAFINRVKPASSHTEMELHQEATKGFGEGFNGSDGKLHNQATNGLPTLLEGNHNHSAKERKQETPMQRIQTIIDEQRLESAWLQATEKGTPASLNRLKPERNQVLPQDGFYRQNQIASMISAEVSSRKREDEQNREIKALKMNENSYQLNDRTGQGSDRLPLSPSLLHDRVYTGSFDKENMGYESGSVAAGCNGFLCWKTRRHSKGKFKPGTPVRLHKRKKFSLFGQCGTAKRTESRFKR